MKHPLAPTTEQIIAMRKRADLTQTEAATLLHQQTVNGYQKWEYGERDMHPAIYELFVLKVKKIVAAKARKKSAAAARKAKKAKS